MIGKKLYRPLQDYIEDFSYKKKKIDQLTINESNSTRLLAALYYVVVRFWLLC